MINNIYVFIILVISFIYFCHGERTRDKMYVPITGASCIRRLNATHQTGCTSARQGSVGALHAIHSESDFEFVLNSGTSPPYAVLMPPIFFNDHNMMQLKESARVTAVIVTNNTESLNAFSTESKCPNQFIGKHDEYCDASDPLKSWNQYGSNLMHQDFPFPILFISDEEQINLLYKCFEKFNNFDIEKQFQRSLCSVELSSFMAAAANSKVCHRRSELSKNLSPVKFCDPLGDKNIFATLFPRPYVNSSDNNIDDSLNASNNTVFEYKTELNGMKHYTDDNSVVDKFTEKKIQKSLTKTEEREKLILLMARIDTTSMFDGIAPGAMDSLLSFVTLLSTANMLNYLLVRNNIKKSYDKNIFYLLLNGESYDYIGSQRLLYDIEKGSFPPKQDNIVFEDFDMIIEIGSLGGKPNYLSSHYAQNNPKIDNFLQNMKTYSEKNKFGITFHSSQRLPPSSIRTFYSNDNIKAPAMVLTDFDDKFVNPYYHSVYDSASNIKYQYINASEAADDLSKLMNLSNFGDFNPDSVQILVRNISTTLGMALYQEITNMSLTGELGTNPYLIDELLHCYLESADCIAFRAVSPPNKNNVSPTPPYRYVGVAGYINDATIWTARVLAFLTGSSSNRTEEDCDFLPYSWVAGFNGLGLCVQTHANYSEAVSPAFLDEDYDWSSGKYSTWTESTWRDITARMFLRPSVIHETFTLGIGVFVLLVSFFIVWLVNSRSDILFNGQITEHGLPTQC
ncbi:nicastrin [Ctenocephalides felis]|uniref:nicastrin n=1 Tax=Ctenocephalides felis TaxID=7515 RepID=UPI000E6E15B5|nr:nicastrin [Ctenocephalides felis]